MTYTLHGVICFVACWMSVSNEPVTIDVGGPRKVTVVIREGEEAFDLVVSLLPVRAFDAGMNKRLTQEKARSYGIQALIQHVGDGKKKCATVVNAEVVDSVIVDSRLVLTLRVPRKGLRLAEESADVQQGVVKRDVISRQLLFRSKDDFRDTLRVIVEALSDEFPKAQPDRTLFESSIVDVEELGVARFASLCKEVKADRWLLSTDRDELLAEVVAEEDRFLNRLRKLVAEVDERDKRKAGNGP